LQSWRQQKVLFGCGSATLQLYSLEHYFTTVSIESRYHYRLSVFGKSMLTSCLPGLALTATAASNTISATARYSFMALV